MRSRFPQRPRQDRGSGMGRFLLLLLAALAASPLHAQAATPPAGAKAPAGPYRMDPLPYAFAALEPAIDAQTMEIHYGRHYKAYVDNLNRAVAADPALARPQTLEALMGGMSALPKAVRDNGGGAWNHGFFWTSMAPPGTGGQPSPKLLAAIVEAFGSFPAFRKAFQEAGMARFGSGWVWLVLRPDGRLAITSTPNQDNPLMDVVPPGERGIPILGNDVWEHAYYLKYQNRRGDYLSAWWDVVNWNEVSRRFEAARAGR